MTTVSCLIYCRELNYTTLKVIHYWKMSHSFQKQTNKKNLTKLENESSFCPKQDQNRQLGTCNSWVQALSRAFFQEDP